MGDWFKSSMSCFSPSKRPRRQARRDDGLGGEADNCLQCEDLRDHAFGQFSTAVVRGNEVLEDRFRIELGRQATFIGVYDGHGGPQAAEYVNEHLYSHLTRLGREEGKITGDIIRNAFEATENGFRDHVRNGSAPATTGSCCLVGVFWNGRLFVANLGDSRAVTAMPFASTSTDVTACQVTDDHNAREVHIRNELLQLHPSDPEVVFVKNGRWRVKGIIQVTRSIGDFYLKHQEFNVGPALPKFYIEEPIVRPILRADPELNIREIYVEECGFYIFASDGLWDLLDNQEAVDIVREFPREGIARRLAVRAMTNAAARSSKTYSGIKKADNWRGFHDDITVVVIFVDRQVPLDDEASTSVQSDLDYLTRFAQG